MFYTTGCLFSITEDMGWGATGGVHFPQQEQNVMEHVATVPGSAYISTLFGVKFLEVSCVKKCVIPSKQRLREQI